MLRFTEMKIKPGVRLTLRHLIIVKLSRPVAGTLLFATLVAPLLYGPETFAQDQAPSGIPGAPPQAAPDPNAPAIPGGAKKEDTGLFDQASPYLEYGDFNMAEEENQDALYFQYGRFFGVSLGLGYQTATGNRGALYDPAIPRFDIRIHYWFDFNFAMDLGVFFANHSFNLETTSYQTKFIGFGVHLKYYFDVRDSSAALSFANPFLEGGIGQWSESQTHTGVTIPDTDSSLSVDFGGGLEFPIVYKKTYFIVEALYHTQSFNDSKDTETYVSRVPNLNGGFFTLMGHFMFVW
jgi:hypothetical protein